jgi:hypothetical protein
MDLRGRPEARSVRSAPVPQRAIQQAQTRERRVCACPPRLERDIRLRKSRVRLVRWLGLGFGFVIRQTEPITVPLFSRIDHEVALLAKNLRRNLQQLGRLSGLAPNPLLIVRAIPLTLTNGSIVTCCSHPCREFSAGCEEDAVSNIKEIPKLREDRMIGTKDLSDRFVRVLPSRQARVRLPLIRYALAPPSRPSPARATFTCRLKPRNSLVRLEK